MPVAAAATPAMAVPVMKFLRVTFSMVPSSGFAGPGPLPGAVRCCEPKANPAIGQPTGEMVGKTNQMTHANSLMERIL